MARKKTNAQKARERRRIEGTPAHPTASHAETTQVQSQQLERERPGLFSRKRTTVIIFVILGLLFTAAMFGAERLLRDDDPTPTVEAAAGAPDNDGAVSSPVIGTESAIVRDAQLSDRCWPNGGPVPGNAVDAAEPPSMALEDDLSYSAVITTNYGSFTIQFYPEDAPTTVNNFVCLANAGYYDRTIFHRVIDGFMFQGGDPLGSGTGGPGYRFPDEPIVRDYVTGTLAMANAGPDTQGSQFFVVLDNLTELQRLPKNYTIFGQVTDGLDVVQAIGKVEVGMSQNGELSAPTSPVELISVEIITSQKG